LTIFAFLLLKFPWSQIYETLIQRPAGMSMLDPFDIGDLKKMFHRLRTMKRDVADDGEIIEEKLEV